MTTNFAFGEPSLVSLTNTPPFSIPIEYRECMARVYDRTVHSGGDTKSGKVIEGEIYEKAESKQQYCKRMFDKIYADQMEMMEQNKIIIHEAPTMRTIGSKNAQKSRMIKKSITLKKVRKSVVFKRKSKRITLKYQI